jgi:hypothetical protein
MMSRVQPRQCRPMMKIKLMKFRARKKMLVTMKKIILLRKCRAMMKMPTM